MVQKAHVSDKKKKVVEEFVELIEKYPVIGVVNMTNLPTKTVQDQWGRQVPSTVMLLLW